MGFPHLGKQLPGGQAQLVCQGPCQQLALVVPPLPQLFGGHGHPHHPVKGGFPLWDSLGHQLAQRLCQAPLLLEFQPVQGVAEFPLIGQRCGHFQEPPSSPGKGNSRRRGPSGKEAAHSRQKYRSGRTAFPHFKHLAGKNRHQIRSPSPRGRAAFTGRRRTGGRLPGPLPYPDTHRRCPGSSRRSCLRSPG